MADSKKKRVRRRFSDEFKREAVALYRSSGVSAAQEGEELEKELRRTRRELDF